MVKSVSITVIELVSSLRDKFYYYQVVVGNSVLSISIE